MNLLRRHASDKGAKCPRLTDANVARMTRHCSRQIMSIITTTKTIVALLSLATLIAHIATLSIALENNLARTPPMGWMAWTRFTCNTNCDQDADNCISQHLFRRQADKLVEDGYSKLGYEYINIDDCWSEHHRDSKTNKLLPDERRFNSVEGMKNLSKYIHKLHLKLGIYGDCGLKTCAGYPAQLKQKSANLNNSNEIDGDYFKIDAETLEDWQIDAFKFDGCYIDPLKAESICPSFSKVLAEQTKPIMLICEWPFYMMYAHAKPNYKLASDSCNMWRYYDDIEDSWSSILNTIDYTIKHQSTIVKYHGPGHWFDPDQLVIGNFGLSFNQERAQMAIWSLWSAPLYMSNDLRDIRQSSSKILKNSKLIKINQDPMGVWALMVNKDLKNGIEVFVKPIMPIKNNCPSFAILYLNRNTLAGRIEASFKLGDLLLAAPIYEAAKNERSIEDWEPQIKPGSCLQRLAEATKKSSSSSSSWSSSSSSSSYGEEHDHQSNGQIVYHIEDLYENQEELANIRASEQLKLEVEPSGVRVIRLEERTG